MLSSVFSRHVIPEVSVNVSEEPIASNFRVEDANLLGFYSRVENGGVGSSETWLIPPKIHGVKRRRRTSKPSPHENLKSQLHVEINVSGMRVL
jgi:hypothetical protein